MGILQARMLEWVAMPSSRGSSQSRDQTHVFHIAGEFFTVWVIRGATVKNFLVLGILYKQNHNFFALSCRLVSLSISSVFIQHHAFLWLNNIPLGFPGGSDDKESSFYVGDLGLIPGLGRSPKGGHGNPLQDSCLENPHEQRSLVGYSPHDCKELDTTEWLSTTTLDIWHFFFIHSSHDENLDCFIGMKWYLIAFSC